MASAFIYLVNQSFRERLCPVISLFLYSQVVKKLKSLELLTKCCFKTIKEGDNAPEEDQTRISLA